MQVFTAKVSCVYLCNCCGVYPVGDSGVSVFKTPNALKILTHNYYIIAIRHEN